MTSLTGETAQTARRSGLVSVRVIAGDCWHRTLRSIGLILRRNADQPQRLERLRSAILRDSRAPFGAAAAVAEIHRFLADPAAYRSPEAAWWESGEGLAGAHIRHALDAQALAFSNRPRESAEAMKRALDQLDRPPESEAIAATRHRALLRALAESFRRDQDLLASEDD
jgi:hypothetical protein